MGHMPPVPRPIDLDAHHGAPQPESVVEFGGPAPRRRWSVPGFARGLLADRRLVPLTAVLGAVAVFASLVSEWQVTTVDPQVFGGQVGMRPISTGVTDVGALGTAYLVGLFPLVATVVLTLFGPAAGRRWARLAGLSFGGTTLALVFATVASLGDQSRTVPDLYLLQFDKDQVTFVYGRGLWCAVAGVLLAMVALYLAVRHPAPAVPQQSRGEEQPEWNWRRPAPIDEAQPDQPLELTVGPAKPFTSYAGDDRDKPSRS